MPSNPTPAAAAASSLAASSHTPLPSDSPAKARARRSCGVCADDMEMFAEMRKHVTADEQATTSGRANATTAASIPTAVAIGAATAAAATSSSAPRRPLPCPPDSSSLGRATWTFLHTMSAYYPDQPTPLQQTRMSSFLANFASFYPCPPCAEHLQQHIERHPPPTHSRTALSLFLCQYHNSVNHRLGKKQFDCDRYDERWKDGPKEDAGYDCIEEPTPADDTDG